MAYSHLYRRKYINILDYCEMFCGAVARMEARLYIGSVLVGQPVAILNSNNA